MFGYVIARKDTLSEEEQARYKGCYCGLCRALRESHGNLSRLALNYDMTFLILVLASLYEPEEQAGAARCPVHRKAPALLDLQLFGLCRRPEHRPHLSQAAG